MDDSEFWRALAVEFQAMANEHDTLSAVWTYVPKVGKDQWWLDGPTSPADQQRYETLAVRAGKKIDPTSSDPLPAWLGFIKGERPIKAGTTPLGDESPCVYGTIDRLCSTSAETCEILIGRTVHAVLLEASSSPIDDSSFELRSLGLTLDIDENTARQIMGELLIIDGLWRKGKYPPPYPEGHSRGHFDAAYEAIASGVVHAETSIDVLENLIPAVVQAFKTKQKWLPKIAIDVLKQWLQGSINEWKGKRLLMKASASPTPLGSPKEDSGESFPMRATWLRDRLRERAWDHNDPARHGGPDRKTIDKILRGESVREEVLEKLAKSLSKKHGAVDLLSIPRD